MFSNLKNILIAVEGKVKILLHSPIRKQTKIFIIIKKAYILKVIFLVGFLNLGENVFLFFFLLLVNIIFLCVSDGAEKEWKL